VGAGINEDHPKYAQGAVNAQLMASSLKREPKIKGTSVASPGQLQH
jgi:hypothetical protein